LHGPMTATFSLLEGEALEQNAGTLTDAAVSAAELCRK